MPATSNSPSVGQFEAELRISIVFHHPVGGRTGAVHHQTVALDLRRILITPKPGEALFVSAPIDPDKTVVIKTVRPAAGSRTDIVHRIQSAHVLEFGADVESEARVQPESI